MTRLSARLALCCAAMLLPAGVALGDPVPAAQTAPAPVDPERMALARQIIAIVLPPDRAVATIDQLGASILRPLETMLRQQIRSDDPGLNAIVDDFLKTMPGTLRDTMAPRLPEMADVMARAYTRKFDRAELAQILAFGQTPTGQKYLSRSTELVQDPELQAFYARLVPAAQAQQAPALAEFKRKLTDYLAAHPDVAKKMQQTSSN